MGKKIEVGVGDIASIGTGAAGGIAAGIFGVPAAASSTAVGGVVITSGLATIGSVVGGGMAAGLGIVAAAPVLGGLGLFGLYKGISKLMK